MTAPTPTPAPAIVEPQPMMFTTPAPLLVRAEASTIEYRAAREQAEREGRQLVVAPRVAPAPVQHPAGTIFLHRSATPQQYATAKKSAESLGVSIVFLPEN